MTITLTREEAQQVLDALAPTYKMDLKDPQFQAVKILCTALAQPEPEPVAWRFYYKNMWSYVDNISDLSRHKFEPLYIAPPQREWQGLTHEEEIALAKKYRGGEIVSLIGEVTAKLREKNT